MSPAEQTEFSTLVARLPVAIYRTTPDGRILVANQALADLLGFETVEELQQQNAADMYVDARDRDDVVRRFADGTMPPANDLRLRKRDGTIAWIRSRSHAVDRGDGVVYFEGVMTDISEQKRAEARLQASEARFRTVFEASPIGMVMRGSDLRAIAANPAICTLLDMTEDDIIAAAVADLLVPDDVARVHAALTEITSGRLLRYQGEHRLLTAGRTVKTVLAHLTRLTLGDDDACVLGQFVDISERKLIEDRLADSVSSKERLVQTVSHELRTPLTTVVGFASELVDRVDLSTDEQSELIEHIERQSREMAELVDDLLAEASTAGDDIEPAPVDLETTCREVLESWQEPTVTMRTTDGDGAAWADPFRVRQILRNLLTNAARYGEPPVEVVVSYSGTAAMIEVCDQGAGLAPEHRDAIFEPYGRAHADTPGALGLGLSVSRDLARAMDGDLAYRVVDGCSVFELRLPRFENPS
ncbi:MAG: PAS domain S-box protein [Acidimicrobiia bacterium]